MKKLITILLLTVLVVYLIGCGSNGIKAPKTEDSYIGVEWKTANDEFADAGFSNISTKEIKDIDAKSTIKEGSIESISVNGETDYSTETEYDKEAEVIITYHALAEYKADIHVDFIGNFIFDKYDVDILIDGETKDTMEHGEDKDIQLVLPLGEHTITFANAKNPSVKGESTLNVTSDLEAEYTISCKSDIVSVREDYVDYKVELEEGQVKTTTSSDDFYGENYKSVIEELKSMGFTNIKAEPLYDIVYGITDDGELESIQIDGKEGFKRGEVYSSDVEVIVNYHTLEENDPAVIAEKKKEEEERKAEEARIAEEEKKAEEERLAEEARLAEEEAQREAEANKTLTVENCEELQQILSMYYTSCPEYEEFASKYKGKKIEFDGSVDYMVHHGSYDTRWDFLLSVGDYDADHQIGPTFKLEDVNYYDLHTDLEEVRTGQNVHIIARIDEFDSEHELFYLDPVEITGR